MKKSNFIIFIFLLTCHAVSGNSLVLHFQLVDDTVSIRSEIDDDIVSVTYSKHEIMEMAEEIYEVVEGKQHKHAKTFSHTRHRLSEIILQPFHSKIESCREIQIRIHPDLIRIPFEYLLIDGKELGLVKPLYFTLDNVDSGFTLEPIRMSSGFIIRDRTCDPENACKTVSKEHSNFAFYRSSKISPKQLVGKNLDVLLVSAHGYADKQGKGGLGWNREGLHPDSLSSLNPRLVYFDSCQQGVNLTYINALKGDKLNYYLGPIISNDSGDSSTKTIEWFFEYIDLGFSPDEALYATKVKLNRNYSGRRILTRLNKALSFRIYVL